MTATTGPGTRAWASLSWTPLYRVAGAAALLFVLFDVAALALYAVDAPPASGGEATLQFIAGHKASYIAQQLLWLVPSLFGLVVFTALLVALLPTNAPLALLGFVVGAASWTALLAVPTSSVGTLSLVTLSDAWSAADDAARPAFVAAAEALVAENNTATLAGALTPLGVLLISVPMVRGPLPHWMGWLGIATGALGLASEVLRFAVTALYTVYGPLLWVWIAAVGIALLGLAGHRARKPVE
ncbi:DUF4386 family protein [Sinomonas soli]